MIIKRFERKWIYNKNYLNLINILIRSKFFFHFQFSKRQVNSIYFEHLKVISFWIGMLIMHTLKLFSPMGDI